MIGGVPKVYPNKRLTLQTYMICFHVCIMNLLFYILSL